MKKILLIALVLLSCREEEVKECLPTNCFNMIRISKALPVEFYQNGTPSFNTKDEAGIEKNCFKQPFNSEDNIKLQFTDDEATVYNPLLLPPSEWIPVFGTGFVPPLSEVTSTSFYSFLLTAGSVSRHAYQDYELAAGETLRFKIVTSFNGSIQPVLQFVMMDGTTDSSNLVTVILNGENEIVLTATDDSNRLRITVSLDGVSSIVVNMIPDSVKEYDLKVLDEDEEELVVIPFERIPAEVLNEYSTADLAAAATTPNGGTTAWSGGTVNLSLGSPSSAQSHLKYFPVTVPGDQRVRMFIESSHTQPFGSGDITAASMTVGLFNAAFELIGSHTFNVDVSSPLSVVHTFDFEIDEDAAYVGAFTNVTGTGACTATTFLDYMRLFYNMYPETGIFEAELVPMEEDILNEYISLQIVDEDDVMVYYTDLLDIQELHADTRTVHYTNENDFAGIIYDDEEIEVPPVFMIRLESKFYEPVFPQEDESENMGDGTVEKLSGSVKEQRLLEIEPLPPFMIRKIAYILAHNSLYLENQSWIKEENFEHEKLNDKYAFFQSSVKLTLKDDTFVTNVFGG